MSGYIRDETGYVFSFAERTLSNLQLIEYLEKTNKNVNAYETTQLINSAIGLLVFPKEKYYNDMLDDFSFPYNSDEAKLLTNINYNGRCHVDYYSDEKLRCQIRNYVDRIYIFKSPKQLARRLRNALCHNRLEIMPKQKPNSTGGKIAGFVFTDQGRVEEEDYKSNQELKYMIDRKELIHGNEIDCWQRITLELSKEELRILLIGICKLILKNSKESHALSHDERKKFDKLDEKSLFWKEEYQHGEE